MSACSSRLWHDKQQYAKITYAKCGEWPSEQVREITHDAAQAIRYSHDF